MGLSKKPSTSLISVIDIGCACLSGEIFINKQKFTVTFLGAMLWEEVDKLIGHLKTLEKLKGDEWMRRVIRLNKPLCIYEGRHINPSFL